MPRGGTHLTRHTQKKERKKKGKIKRKFCKTNLSLTVVTLKKRGGLKYRERMKPNKKKKMISQQSEGGVYISRAQSKKWNTILLNRIFSLFFFFEVKMGKTNLKTDRVLRITCLAHTSTGVFLYHINFTKKKKGRVRENLKDEYYRYIHLSGGSKLAASVTQKEGGEAGRVREVLFFFLEKRMGFVWIKRGKKIHCFFLKLSSIFFSCKYSLIHMACRWTYTHHLTGEKLTA